MGASEGKHCPQMPTPTSGPFELKQGGKRREGSGNEGTRKALREGERDGERDRDRDRDR